MRGKTISSERAYLVHVAAATLLVFLAAAFSAITIPLFGGPDEKNHYNSVVRVADGGGWPLPYTAIVEPSVTLAWLEAGRGFTDGTKFDTTTAPEDRSNVVAEFDLVRPDIDNMVQHPPLYYFISAGAVAAVGLENLRWDQAMLVMRLVSAVLVSMAVPAIAGAIRLITRSRSLGAVGGYALLTVPFFTGFAGLVSNDTLLVPTISGALYLAIRAWRSTGRVLPLLVGSGVLFGLALLTKGFALFAFPLLFGFSIIAAYRGGTRGNRRIVFALVPCVVAGLIGGWWWIRNIILVGSVQPSVAGNLRVPLDEPFAGVSLARYLYNFLLRFNSLFWARGVRGGDGGEELPVVLVALAGIVFVIAAIAVVFLSKNRGVTILMLSFPAVIMVILFVNSYKVYETFGVADRGVQGRYVFGAIIAYATVFAGFIGILGRRMSMRVRRAFFSAVVLGSVVIAWGNNWWLLLTAWPNAYSPDGSSQSAASYYFDVPYSAYVALTAFAALVIFGALFASSRRLSSEDFARDLTDSYELEVGSSRR